MNAVFLWIPQAAAVLRIERPFIIQSMYFSHTARSFLVPDMIELVAITKDLPQSLQIYLCVPSFLWPLRTTWIHPHKGHTRPLENLSFVTNSSISKVLTKAGLKSIVLRLSCSAAVNLLIISSASLIVGISSHSFYKCYLSTIIIQYFLLKINHIMWHSLLLLSIQLTGKNKKVFLRGL